MKKVITAINALFLALIFAFLGFGLLKAYIAPIDTNEYENRTAEKMPALSLSGFLNGDFQDGCESALGDQSPAAIHIKRAYNAASSKLQLKGMEILESLSGADRYTEFGGLLYKDGYLMAKMRDTEKEKPGINECVANMSAAIEGAKDVPTYAYYVKRDEDNTFETGAQSGFYEYLQECLEGTGLYESVNCYSIDSVSEYMRDFFKTDHHWNAVGARRGYEEVLSILAPGDTPILPAGEELLPINYAFEGAYARTAGAVGIVTEELGVYNYPFPAVEVRFNLSDTVYPNYGGQYAYMNGLAEKDTVSYADFYGADISRIVFDNPNNSDGENVLLIGDSFDNAILWLLSGHFDTLHSIDIRNYVSEMGENFSYGEYLQENNITKVMFIGSNDFYCSTLKNLEG